MDDIVEAISEGEVEDVTQQVEDLLEDNPEAAAAVLIEAAKQDAESAGAVLLQTSEEDAASLLGQAAEQNAEVAGTTIAAGANN